jgi:uncharacterized protein
MAEPSWTARGRVLVSGAGEGPALVLDEPLSFWGGLDHHSGLIIDTRHAQRGRSVAGTVLVMPGGRGSSSSSSVLAEAIRLGRGPQAVLMPRADGIVVLGALVVQLLDGESPPVLEVGVADLRRISDGEWVSVAADGLLEVGPARALP